ncbi:hypothetical protein [Roseomonas rosulenta]|uniref:hypothetical protein n=1 Tax=Roseomonas rosulenta TaxID=2748667 RepID=UPI0018DF7EA5|nr:hypothetical protein [Roseomonas rosulenta]
MHEALADFAAWAWARHHNEWSWYVRPLFLIPYCWFAWRRSLAGLIVTVLALATSMFWFPAPAQPSALAAEVLAAERAYLLAPWTPWKVAVALLVPLGLTALALAFWRRSLAWGLVVLNALPLAKIAWSFVVFSRQGALHHLVPAVLGLLACNSAVAGALWWRARFRAGMAADRPAPPAPPPAGRAR